MNRISIVRGSRPVWEGEINITNVPQTAAAAMIFSSNGNSKKAAEAIRDALRGATEPRQASLQGDDVLSSSWIWSEKDGGVVLSIVTRNEDGEFFSYLGFLL